MRGGAPVAPQKSRARCGSACEAPSRCTSKGTLPGVNTAADSSAHTAPQAPFALFGFFLLPSSPVSAQDSVFVEYCISSWGSQRAGVVLLLCWLTGLPVCPQVGSPCWLPVKPVTNVIGFEHLGVFTCTLGTCVGLTG